MINASPETMLMSTHASSSGFGFIWDNASAEIGDVDIFIHWTTIQGEASFKSLGEGEMVEYELARGPKVRSGFPSPSLQPA